MPDLSPRQMAILCAILARHVPGREVRAFGSRVTGRAWCYSDLDLVVMGDEPLADLVRANLVANLEESDLPFHVDLIEAQDLPASWAAGFDARFEPIYQPAEAES